MPVDATLEVKWMAVISIEINRSRDDNERGADADDADKGAPGKYIAEVAPRQETGVQRNAENDQQHQRDRRTEVAHPLAQPAKLVPSRRRGLRTGFDGFDRTHQNLPSRVCKKLMSIRSSALGSHAPSRDRAAAWACFMPVA